MKLLISIRIVGFLKHRYVVCTAFVKVLVFIGIDRIDFKSYHTEILSCQLAGFTDIFHVALASALTGKDQDFLHTAVGDDLHLFFNLLHTELHAVDMVVTVKTTIDTVILAVVGYVQGSEQIHGITKMLTCFQSCTLRHLFKERFRCWRKECLEIFYRTGIVFQSCFHIGCSIF